MCAASLKLAERSSNLGAEARGRPRETPRTGCGARCRSLAAAPGSRPQDASRQLRRCRRARRHWQCSNTPGPGRDLQEGHDDVSVRHSAAAARSRGVRSSGKSTPARTHRIQPVSGSIRWYLVGVQPGASPYASYACVDTWLTDFRSDLPKIDIPTLVVHGPPTGSSRSRPPPPGCGTRR
jgi:hypothetical protein